VVSKAFGEVLRELRLERGLSQERLALEMGLHRTYVSQLERGVKSPTLRTIWRLSRFLGIDPSQLVRLVEAKHQTLRLAQGEAGLAEE